MLNALGSKPGARALAALTLVVLLADVFVAVARAGEGGKKPDATPSITPTVSKTPTVRATVSKKPTAKPRVTKKPTTVKRSAGCGKAGDFNGDGYADLAIGVPKKDADSLRDSGSVQVLYGSATGVKPRGTQVFSQASFASLTHAARGDQFGFSLATGDFNGDGFSDLAVGAPFKQLGDTQEAGAVFIIAGSRTGLTNSKAQMWTQDSAGIGEESQLKDRFGQALAAGDFNRDGFADLAVGAPFEDVINPGHLGVNGPQGSAGVINVLLGSSGLLTSKGNQVVDQNFLKLTDTSNSEDLFSWTLTAGDFDGDGFCDVIAGVPGQKVGSKTSAGAINMIRGGAVGLVAAGAQFWTLDNAGIAGEAAQDDQFGSSLAAGDFNHDGRADIAVGTFFKSVGAKTRAGIVSTIYGSRKGLTSVGNQMISLDTKGIKGGPAANDMEFGFAVATGDFNGDSYADLAIGVPYKTFTKTDVSGSTTLQAAGEVVVIPGASGGLRVAGSSVWTQDSPSIQDETEADDLFGYAVATGDYNKDGRADLCVGVPNEGFSAEQTNVGAINVILSSRSGLNAKGNQYFYEGHGIAGAPAPNDAFGSPVES